MPYDSNSREMKPPIEWSGHDRHWIGYSGRQNVAIVALEHDGWAVYDPQEPSPGQLGALIDGAVSDVEEAKRRAGERL